MPAQAINSYVEDPLIRSMRVRTWFHAVIEASGLTAAQLEREFADGGGKKAPRSCIWNKYRRGEVVPRSGRQGDGRPRLVERVEARYAGTAKWLFSPLWRLADKAPMEMSEIRKVYERLPRLMRSIFIHEDAKSSHVFWRRPVDCADACEILQRYSSVEGLVAVLAMAKEAEITQDQVLHWISFKAALTYADGARKYPVLTETMGDLRDYLKKRQGRVEYFSLPDDDEEWTGD